MPTATPTQCLAPGRRWPLLCLLCLLLLNGAFAARAQLIFQKCIGTGIAGAERGSQMIRCRAGGYLLAGVRNGPYLARVNEDGDTLWTKQYSNFYSINDFNGGLNGLSVCENRSGQILFACRGSSLRSRGVNMGGALLLLDGTNGDLIWSQVLQSPYQDSFGPVCLAADGHFVLGAQRLGIPVLQKIDSTGTEIWNTYYAGFDTTAALMGNLCTMPGGFAFTVHDATVKHVLRVSEAGQLLSVGPAFFSGYIWSRLVRDERNGLLLANGALDKLTATGDTVWTRRYRRNGKGVTIRAVALTADSNYVALGSIYNVIEGDWVLLKIAYDGTLIRDSVFWRYPGSEAPVDVLLDPQGNYTLFGYTSDGLISPTPDSPDLLLAKYRPWRQVLGRAPDPDAALPAAAAAAVFPNPLDGPGPAWLCPPDGQPLRGTLTLRDARGRLLRTQHLPPQGLTQAPVPLAGQPPGLYLLTLLPPEGRASQTWRLVKR